MASEVEKYKPINKDQLEKIHISAWTRFNSNVGAIYSFFEKVTEVAHALDKEKIKKMSIELASLFKEKPEIIEKDLLKYLPSVDDLDVYPDVRNDNSVKEMMAALRDSELIDAMQAWEKKHPYKSQKFLKILYSTFNDPPIKGIILRKSMLVMLITFFEMLFEDLFVNYHLSQNESRDNALVLAKKMLEDGWGKRLSSLSETGIVVDAQLKYVNEIIEITKRRNLIVHNDGVVDDKYIRNAPQKYKNLTPGSTLVVSTHYFQRAIDIIYSLGFLLCMASWRVNKINEQEQYRKLDEFVISSLNQKRYSLVLELTKNLDDIEISDIVRQRMMVDRAIVFRELGKNKEVERIVSKLVASDHDWQIDAAICMLSNNYYELKRQLEHAHEKYGNIGKLSAWPLFEPIKDEAWFRIVFTRRSKQELQQFNRARRKK